jgi:hypothetical protein
VHQIEANPLAHRREREILVADIDHRAAQGSGKRRAVIERLVLHPGTEHHAPLGQVRLEQLLERDAARVLPLLKRGRRLRVSPYGHQQQQRADSAPFPPYDDQQRLEKPE